MCHVRSREIGVAVSAYERKEHIQLAVGVEHTRCCKIINRLDRRHVAEQFIDVDAESGLFVPRSLQSVVARSSVPSSHPADGINLQGSRPELISPGTQRVRSRFVTGRNFPSSTNAGTPEIAGLQR